MSNYPIIDQAIATFEGFGNTLTAPSITYGNNPGAIQYGDFAVSQGAIGAANGFAVFPDPSTGYAALDSLVTSKVAAGATPTTLIQGGAGVTGWAAPTAPGNTQAASDAYSQAIAQATGVGLNTPLSTATPGSAAATSPPPAGSGNPLAAAFAGLFGYGLGLSPSQAGAVTAAAGGTGTGWFSKLSLNGAIAIVLGLVLIITGIIFLRPVTDAVTSVTTQAGRVARVF